MQDLPVTLGTLKKSNFSEQRLAARSVKDELRQNLICKLQRGDDLFPGVVGYEETVIPQIVNAVLSKHNFILLGLRGQAKTKIIRMLTALLDEHLPYIAGCEIRDNPYQPICRRCRNLVEEQGDYTPIAWLDREERYVEKLATPDVTIADMIGDIDPIKAARSGHDLSSELTVHYGLMPRANRGIFAINELPDLAGKNSSGALQHHAGRRRPDQRLPGAPSSRHHAGLHRQSGGLHRARKDHHAVEGSHRQRDSHSLSHHRRSRPYPSPGRNPGPIAIHPPAWKFPITFAKIVEQLAFLAREDKKVDKRSGVSQRLPISVLENVVSNAERRALRAGETVAVPRVLDIYSALAFHHRQAGAGIRRRIEGRRQCGPRADPSSGRERSTPTISTA